MARPRQREDRQYGAGPRPAPGPSVSDLEAAEKNDRPCVKAAQEQWEVDSARFPKTIALPTTSRRGKPPIKGDGSGYRKRPGESQ